MKTFITVTVLTLLAATAVLATADDKTTVARSDALSIEFIDGGSGDAAMTAAGSEAWVDGRSMSGTPSGRITRRRFGIRVLRSGVVTGGTAVITARVDATDGRAVLRLDGRPLTAVPLVADAHAAIGRVTYHTIEVEIAADAEEGPFATTIAWEATTD